MAMRYDTGEHFLYGFQSNSIDKKPSFDESVYMNFSNLLNLNYNGNEILQ
jgi:hypothetical protein